MKIVQVQERTFTYILEGHQILGVPPPGNLIKSELTDKINRGNGEVIRFITKDPWFIVY